MMSGTRRCFYLVLAIVLVSPSGCFVPKSQWNEAQAERRVFADQNKAQLVEIERLKTHAKKLEENLVKSEEELAIVQQQSELDRGLLARYEKEHADLVEQYRVASRDAKTSPVVGKRLQELAKRNPSLNYDVETGLSKFDTDILFGNGESELQPGAEQQLADLARVLRSPEARGMKVMVVGHTDRPGANKRSVREGDADPFQISTARALAVAERLKQEGVREDRIGVAGLGASQPIASNTSAVERPKNRRVEIFLVSPETPVVGWTDSIPKVYRTASQEPRKTVQ